MNPEDINETAKEVARLGAESAKLGQKSLSIGERFFSPTLARREHKAKLLEIGFRLKEGKDTIDAAKELLHYGIGQLGYSEKFLLNNPLGAQELIKKVIEFTNLDSIYQKSQQFLDQSKLVGPCEDHDFYMEFKKKAGSINTELGQDLFARALARKMEDEDSIRRSTIEVLGNLEADDAQMLQLLASFSIKNRVVFIPGSSTHFLEERFNDCYLEPLFDQRLIKISHSHLRFAFPANVHGLEKDKMIKILIAGEPLYFRASILNAFLRKGGLSGNAYACLHSIAFSREASEICSFIPKNKELTFAYMRSIVDKYPNDVFFDLTDQLGPGVVS